jgi:hypothetical protein
MLRRVLHYKTKVTPVAAGASVTAVAEAAAAAHQASSETKQSKSTALLQLIRFDPATNTKRVDTYEYVKTNAYMVLDLLVAVKAFPDPTLAFRASCCEGVCGSCSMNINGVNSLACITFADDKRTLVGPLPNFPILKDMVVDLKGFFKQYQYIRPYIRNVYLPQMRIDGIYDKYLSTAAALYGERVSATAGASAGASSSAADATTAVLGHPGAYVVYTKMLDRVVTTGDAAKAAAILLKMRSEGYTVDDTAARQILRDALKNKKA